MRECPETEGIENGEHQEYPIERKSVQDEWLKIVIINLIVAASVSLAKAALDYLLETYRSPRREPPYPYSW